MKISILLFLALALLTELSIAQCSADREVTTGAERTELYLPLIGDRQIALVANHTSLVGEVHLLDTLLSSGIATGQIEKLFCPEHGFRGERGAGVSVDDHADPLTGIAVQSLYGSHKKPSAAQMSGLDLVLFDLQDVGTRFYTYISTLHYIMESCAESGVPLIVLDRPNPNGGYVDGPIMEKEFVSFVGMHPIPVVYGMTIGELAQMINGEGWLSGGVQCELTIVPCEHYKRDMTYSLPVRPSPNLANDHAIQLYPSTCFFEGTVLSEGRGTAMPFEVYGHPKMNSSFSFTPLAIEGVAENPKFKGERCFGTDLRGFIPGEDRIFLEFLLEAYAAYPDKGIFFIPYFEKLAGTADLRWQIEAGYDQSQIRASWQDGINNFLEKREQYLIYK